MIKKKILITGSLGHIGSFLVKKLKNKYKIITLDVREKNKIINDKLLKNIFNQNIYAVIFAHGKNTTPYQKKKNQLDLDIKNIKEHLESNLFFNLRVISHYIKNNKKGRIINFSSIYGVRSPKHYIYKNFYKEIGYSLSKSASNMMIKYLGTALAKKFKFNSLILGGVKGIKLSNYFVKNYSVNNPTGRMMNLNEILPAVNYLLDESNTYTNAQDLIIDGGWLSW